MHITRNLREIGPTGPHGLAGLSLKRAHLKRQGIKMKIKRKIKKASPNQRT